MAISGAGWCQRLHNSDPIPHSDLRSWSIDEWVGVIPKQAGQTNVNRAGMEFSFAGSRFIHESGGTIDLFPTVVFSFIFPTHFSGSSTAHLWARILPASQQSIHITWSHTRTEEPRPTPNRAAAGEWLSSCMVGSVRWWWFVWNAHLAGFSNKFRNSRL